MNSLNTLQNLFTGKRLLLPVGIGLVVAALFFCKNFDADAFSAINWSGITFFWLAMAFCMVVLRLFAYAYRLRHLSDNAISWRSAIQVIILWEFSSAITPGIVGGTAAAFVLLAQEKNLNTGQSTAIVIATSYLDVLFYVVMVPIMLLFTGLKSQIPEKVGPFDQSVVINYFSVAYLIFVVWAVLLYIGLFHKPKTIGRAVMFVFSLPLLNRWKSKAKEWSKELTIASSEFRLKKRSFWTKAFGTTIVAWTARFLVVNFLILALGNGTDVLAIFVKQLIMWGALMLPVTPGASGMAELLFSSFFGEYFANQSLANTTSILWRLISYYPYLFAGVIVFPIWLRERISK